MEVSIQDKNLLGQVTDIKLKLVRTYKGDIERTQTGVISAFPTSFVTPGFDLTFTGTVEEIRHLEQIALSQNIIKLVIDYNGINIRGMFSCTTNDLTLLKDKGERHAQLGLSFVSDGTPILSSTNQPFTVQYGNTVIISGGQFSKLMAVPAQYRSKKLNGFTVGERLLILGNHVLTD